MTVLESEFWEKELRSFHGITQYGEERGAEKAATRTMMHIMQRVIPLPDDWKSEGKAHELRSKFKIREDFNDVWSLDRLFHLLANKEVEADECYEEAVLFFLCRLIYKEMS